MTRKHNLMVAALVTAALASAWFFSDSGRAPFSRKGMAAPVAVEDAAAEQAPPAPPTEAPTAEEVEHILTELARRTECAAAVQDAASARAFLELVQTQKGLTRRASAILYLLPMRADGGEECREPALVELREVIEQRFGEHLQAVNAMYNRLEEADGYGDPLVQACLAFNEAVLLNIAAEQTLHSLETRRQMDEWERRQAEEEAAEAAEEEGSRETQAFWHTIECRFAASAELP